MNTYTIHNTYKYDLWIFTRTQTEYTLLVRAEVKYSSNKRILER